MSEKSMSKNTRKNVILLHIAVMCFSFSGVIGQYVQVPAVQVAMGRVICSSLLLLAISLVCKDKLTLDSKKDFDLLIGNDDKFCDDGKKEGISFYHFKITYDYKKNNFTTPEYVKTGYYKDGCSYVNKIMKG